MCWRDKLSRLLSAEWQAILKAVQLSQQHTFIYQQVSVLDSAYEL